MNLHWLLPERKGIPVLMYHRIWPNLQDRITQTPEQLEEQLVYLKREGYHSLSLKEYLDFCNGKSKKAGRYVLLTFDDGYVNNLTYAYPLLRKHGFKAVFFIIGDTLEALKKEDDLNQKMSAEQLRSLDKEHIEFAMHGFHHENFKTTSIQDIQIAINSSISAFRNQQIELQLSIAYPYGGRPKSKEDFGELKRWMKERGIVSAFRIGNQVSEIPAKDIYELKRIDIRGTDTLKEFAIKVRKGKLKPF